MKEFKNAITETMRRQKQYFETGLTLPYQNRLAGLEKLKALIEENEPEILEALKVDMRKPELESYASEVGLVLEEINFAIKNLKSWMRTQDVPTSWMHFPSSSKIMAEPKGVVLIISSWNYPVQVLLLPLVAALAAGNCAVLKPSEQASSTASLMTLLVSRFFDDRYVTVINGAVEETTELLKQPFDHIFFTGSTRVGKIVAKAAAENLTPVTLELGGKSPCIVDRDTDIQVTAKRIVWGKFFNAGQTCIAPDYVLVHSSIRRELIEAMVMTIKEFYSSNAASSPDYPRIINKKQFERIISYLDDGDIAYGGGNDASDLFIEPTIIINVKPDADIMHDEIFGPLLPVLTYDNIDEVVSIVRSKPKPLALYLFTRNDKVKQTVTGNLSFGGGCINNTMLQAANPYLPFGGTGNSGMGSYHGKFGFDTFSHYKGITETGFFPDVPLKYAPYTGKISLVKFMLG